LIGSSCVRMTSKGWYTREGTLYLHCARRRRALQQSDGIQSRRIFMCSSRLDAKAAAAGSWSMCVFISKHLRGVISLALNCVCVRRAAIQQTHGCNGESTYFMLLAPQSDAYTANHVSQWCGKRRREKFRSRS